MSVLSNLGNVFENLIYNRLQSFRETSDLIAKNQFGFRKNRYTELTALTLMNNILPALEKKKYTICVFLDNSACFDTLSRSIFYVKLETYGIGVSLNLIKAYFAKMSQHVCYDALSKAQKQALFFFSKYV